MSATILQFPCNKTTALQLPPLRYISSTPPHFINYLGECIRYTLAAIGTNEECQVLIYGGGYAVTFRGKSQCYRPRELPKEIADILNRADI